MQYSFSRNMRLKHKNGVLIQLIKIKKKMLKSCKILETLNLFYKSFKIKNFFKNFFKLLERFEYLICLEVNIKEIQIIFSMPPRPLYILWKSHFKQFASKDAS